METKKRLYKSKSDKKLCGVCGGIAEYFEVDSTLIRLAWILLVATIGTGLLAYIIALIVMPDRPDDNTIETNWKKHP